MSQSLLAGIQLAARFARAEVMLEWDLYFLAVWEQCAATNSKQERSMREDFWRRLPDTSCHLQVLLQTAWSQQAKPASQNSQ
jgi:hypothetical protein